MAVKGKTCVVFFLFVTLVIVSSATVSFGLSKRDPEIGVCKQKCEQIKGAEHQDVQIGQCKKKCEKFFEEKQQREQGQAGTSQHGGRGGTGGGSYNIILAQQELDVRKMVQECHQTCQGSQGEQQRPYCFQQCMAERFQEQETRESGSRGKSSKSGGGQRQQQQSNNPYVFQEQHFTAKLETELGNVRVLQKFTDRSELFNGIEKYRVAFLEAEPQTFIIPNHWDADVLVYVANGEGTISMINQDSRQSHNIKRGDIFRVPAGISVYLINKHDSERLVLAKIIRSVSVPGELQAFFSVGGDQPESSFFNAFSTEVLEAAFDVDRASIERLFGQQRRQQQPGQQQQQQEGIFKRATEEQIKSLSDIDEGRIWPFGQGKQAGPYNIFKERPSVANENGNLHEVDANDLSELRDMNVAFSFFNISQGSMAGPIYNAKATVALVVANGQGQFEMACPHLTEQVSSGGEFSPTYQKVSSELRRGTVVVIPAGHPFVIEANNQDLEVVSFGLNSNVNEWFPLVGRNNVMTQWEDEAIDLTFGVPAREVRQVIQKQNQRFFFKGPVRRGRAFA